MLLTLWSCTGILFYGMVKVWGFRGSKKGCGWIRALRKRRNAVHGGTPGWHSSLSCKREGCLLAGSSARCPLPFAVPHTKRRTAACALKKWGGQRLFGIGKSEIRGRSRRKTLKFRRCVTLSWPPLGVCLLQEGAAFITQCRGTLFSCPVPTYFVSAQTLKWRWISRFGCQSTQI